MFKYFKPYIPRGIIAALFKMGESFADLTLPLIMAKVIDIGVSNKDFEYILSMGGKMILVAGAGYLSAILSNYFSSRTSQEFGANLRESIFTKIQHFTFNQLNKFSQASLITRITKDVDQVTNMFLMCIRMVLRGLTTGIGAVIMAIIINPTLSIIFIIITPLIIYSTLYYMKKSFGLFDLVQKKLDNLTLILRENLSGIRVVRALSKEKIEESRFDKKNDELKEQSIKAESLMISKLPFITLIMNLGVVAVLWFGGINVHYGNMHLGEIVAFINYLNMILFAMNALSFLFTLYSKTSISYKRIKEIVGENIEVVEQEEFEKNLSDNILEFNHVYFSYDKSDRYVLEDIDFKIKRGESIGVIGGIGSGKSTLVSLIPRFFDVVKGEIKIDGVNIKRHQESELRGKIGLVLQKAFLFSQSIRENIMWGNQYATQEDIELVAHISQGKEFIEKFPEKYETELIKGGNNLSGGQKQRIAIARALIQNPEILILDEATSALDTESERLVQDALDRLMVNRTTFVIAHRLSTIINADKIVVMENGRIKEVGRHQDLLDRNGLYKHFYDIQFGKEVKQRDEMKI